MRNVKPKKYLGQHFLNDRHIAEKIVNALQEKNKYRKVLEIGPGMGALTRFLIQKPSFQTYVIDIDYESVSYLKHQYSLLKEKIIEGDFLQVDLKTLFHEPVAVIGNLPYNISSQILFRILAQKDMIPEVVCMLQKEVADRIASPPGVKAYGILSVFLQAYYKIESLFTVDASSFTPPPKVQSKVLRLVRNQVTKLACDEVKFKKIVKLGFQNRRKTLRNALKTLNLSQSIRETEILNKRAEQLSVNDFVMLTNKIYQ